MKAERSLFRGKREDETGAWAIGYYKPDMLEKTHGDMVSCAYITEYDYNESDTHTYTVSRKTVGQCTGWRDKAGALIFEGDIVQHKTYRTRRYTSPWDLSNSKYDGKYDTHSVVIFKNGSWQLSAATRRTQMLTRLSGAETAERVLSHYSELYRYARRGEREDGVLTGIEIIGNIHDNPELLSTERI